MHQIIVGTFAVGKGEPDEDWPDTPMYDRRTDIEAVADRWRAGSDGEARSRTMPKCTGETPMSTAVGRKMGVSSRIAGLTSMKVPKSRTMKLKMSMKTVGPRSRLTR